jgi:hypothetical protein
VPIFIDRGAPLRYKTDALVGSIRVGTLVQEPICTARVLPLVCAAACRKGAVARSGKKRARIRSA